MKKVIFLLIAALTLTLVTYAQTEETVISVSPVETATDQPDVTALKARLYEIKDMDRSNLTKEERKALREEVRSIRTDLTNSNEGVYISFGALVIIILLLIIIL